MVECGKKYFETDYLKFYINLDDCIEEQNSDLILLSSVIQYIEKPYDLLKKIINCGLGFIIDRTVFIKGDKDRLTIQKVPPEIYKASYPAWFFSETKFLKYFEGKYELVEEFSAFDNANIPSRYKGLFLGERMLNKLKELYLKEQFKSSLLILFILQVKALIKIC